jgi:hypothetical protein
MNSVFTNHELRALEILLKHSFQRWREILSPPAAVDAEYTGYGFYVRMSHPSFGTERQVDSGPLISERVDGLLAGFVVF